MPTTVLVARFLLELALLGALGYWDWKLGDGGLTGILYAVSWERLAWLVRR